MAEELKKTYSFYGEDYDYNALRRKSDSGVLSYINSLKEGKKHAKDFLDAYYNIMDGIENGSITINNGRFIDSTGRYTNSDNGGNKDYYGRMANYIFNQMNANTTKYTAPVELPKPEFKNDELNKYFIKELFGNGEANIDTFVDLDPVNKETKTRGITERVNRVIPILTNMRNNFSTLFPNATEAQINKNIGYIDEAIKALKDNKLDSPEKFYLHRLFGSLFADYFTTTAELPTVAKPLLSNNTSEEVPKETPKEKKSNFKYTAVDFTTDNNPYNKYYMVNGKKTEGSEILRKHVETLNLLDTDELKSLFYELNFGSISEDNLKTKFGRYLGNDFANRDSMRIAVAVALKAKKVFNDSSVWDDDDSGMTYKINDDWTVTGTKRTTSEKNGGVLKALNGTKTLKNILSIHTNKYDPIGWDYLNWYGAKLDNGTWILDEKFGNNGQGSGSGRYNRGNEYTEQEGLDYEKSNIYKPWADALLKDLLNIDINNITDELKKSSPVYNFIQNYDKWLKDKNPKSTSTFFDDSGKLRSRWGDNTRKDVFGRQGKVFTDWKEYLKYIINDNILSSGHNRPGQLGEKTYYKIGDTKIYVNNLDDYSDYGYTAGDWGDYGGPDENGIRWREREITPIKTPDEVKDTSKKTTSKNDTKDEKGGKDSKINPSLEAQDIVKPIKPNIRENIAPFIGEAIRLGKSLYANKKIYNIANELQPYFLDPRDHYAPVTGDFSLMLLMNNMAALTNFNGNKPVTSDASLAIATSFLANDKANQLRQQGFLADDKAIEITKKHAEDLTRENINNRNDIANKNKGLLYEFNTLMNSIKRARIQQDWTSTDEFLKSLLAPIQEDYTYNRQYLRLYNNNLRDLKLNATKLAYLAEDKANIESVKSNWDLKIKSLYALKLAALDAWQAKHPGLYYNGDDSTIDNLTTQIKKALEDYQEELLNAMLTYYTNEVNFYEGKPNSRLPNSRLPKKRNGGTINLMIKKVIRSCK